MTKWHEEAIGNPFLVKLRDQPNLLTQRKLFNKNSFSKIPLGYSGGGHFLRLPRSTADCATSEQGCSYVKKNYLQHECILLLRTFGLNVAHEM